MGIQISGIETQLGKADRKQKKTLLIEHLLIHGARGSWGGFEMMEGIVGQLEGYTLVKSSLPVKISCDAFSSKKSGTGGDRENAKEKGERSKRKRLRTRKRGEKRIDFVETN